MPFEQILLRSQRNVVAGFEHAIRIAMHEAHARSIASPPEEPDIVAMLVMEGTPYLANTLREVLSPHGLHCTVSSVFCHQRPEVRLNTGDRCELGDILLVHRHYRRGVIRNNALLLQAKRCGDNGHGVAANERPQLHLYQAWPQFTYVRSGPGLNGQSRDITPKQRHGGAQYLLIDDGAEGLALSGRLGWPDTYCMSVWPASNPLLPFFPFSGELFRMVLGLTGRTFEDDTALDPSGWSQVIWDLLGHSLRYAFNRKRIGVRRQPRAAGDPLTSPPSLINLCMAGDGVQGGDESARFQLQSLLRRTIGRRPHRDGEPPDVKLPPEDLPDDEIPGVSVILIETGDID